MIWGYLIHLGYNMWSDRETPDWPLPHINARPYLRCDDALWEEIVGGLHTAGANLLVIDLAEGIRYDSHPEIGVERSWSPDRLRRELAKIRALGIEPIPKLNFSASHDAWLGPYSRMISSQPYYDVCRDLIAEVSDIFDTPRFFHLGMDEETEAHQGSYNYTVIRKHELWWEDLFFYCREVEKAGVRPWVWSDYIWAHPETFLQKMPKSVLQSNWYYANDFSETQNYANGYRKLAANGYDQIPTASNWENPENLAATVAFCKETISPERLMGFLQSVWRPTLPDCRDRHLAAISQLAAAKSAWDRESAR